MEKKRWFRQCGDVQGRGFEPSESLDEDGDVVTVSISVERGTEEGGAIAESGMRWSEEATKSLSFAHDTSNP